MSSIKTDGIVLRSANYSETSRMLTLLTPQGILSASARGCRKLTSPLLTASELFCAGEYMLYEKSGRLTVTSFQLQENFYPIRDDFDKLAHGVYWLNLCEAAAQPCEDCTRLFRMLLLSLAVLAYGNLPSRALTAVFLAQFAMLMGLSPQLDVCARCGEPAPGDLRFDRTLGGICCTACAREGERMNAQTLQWMQEAQAKGAFVLAGRRALPVEQAEGAAEAAFHFYREHVEYRLDKHITSGRFL